MNAARLPAYPLPLLRLARLGGLGPRGAAAATGLDGRPSP